LSLINSGRQPPSVGPTTGATTTATPDNAKAGPRFAAGKGSARIACETGTMPPPAIPWRIRNSRSELRSLAIPHSTELRVNNPRPARKNALRPTQLLRRLVAITILALATR
jgi:hypothetical protein